MIGLIEGDKLLQPLIQELESSGRTAEDFLLDTPQRMDGPNPEPSEDTGAEPGAGLPSAS